MTDEEIKKAFQEMTPEEKVGTFERMVFNPVPNPFYTDDEERHCWECGEEIPYGDEHEYDYGVYCEDCLINKLEETFTWNNYMSAGEEETAQVEINGLLAYFFDASTIEEILYKALQENYSINDLAEWRDNEYGLDKWKERFGK